MREQSTETRAIYKRANYRDLPDVFKEELRTLCIDKDDLYVTRHIDKPDIFEVSFYAISPDKIVDLVTYTLENDVITSLIFDDKPISIQESADMYARYKKVIE